MCDRCKHSVELSRPTRPPKWVRLKKYEICDNCDKEFEIFMKAKKEK